MTAIPPLVLALPLPVFALLYVSIGLLRLYKLEQMDLTVEQHNSKHRETGKYGEHHFWSCRYAAVLRSAMRFD